ncbi:hypothetical protein H5410_023236 [Solanum commersonii]|uniref:Uncharacterized protein n=1 Tax=Solanum commersonii TaxID=4109 RepID=A0A9J5ZG99_SOLCO|nr:hypothetical protein H5410_023236 [Solanum commersonii]
MKLYNASMDKTLNDAPMKPQYPMESQFGDQLNLFGNKLVGNMKFKVGNGTIISFWKDVWIGQETLMQIFPGLFSFCSNLDITIVESWSNGWDISLRRNLNDWE